MQTVGHSVLGCKCADWNDEILYERPPRFAAWYGKYTAFRYVVPLAFGVSVTDFSSLFLDIFSNNEQIQLCVADIRTQPSQPTFSPFSAALQLNFEEIIVPLKSTDLGCGWPSNDKFFERAITSGKNKSFEWLA